MAEESFPIVDQPMSASQWGSVTKGVGNGILDQGGAPYELADLNNASNTAVIKAGTGPRGANAILEGFYHRLDADATISLPAPAAKVIYYVVLEYDPARNEMPVQLKVVTSLDYAGGKNYLQLHRVERAPNQLLTDASISRLQPRVAPIQVYATEADMPPARRSMLGTLAIIHNGSAHGTAVLKMAIPGDDPSAVNGWFWKTVYDPHDGRFQWEEYPDTSAYRSPSHGFARAIGRSGKLRKLRGRVERTPGSAFSTGGPYQVLSGNLAARDAPRENMSFLTACGGGGVTTAVVEVTKAGLVTARVSNSTYWIGLDGIEWEAM